IQIDASSIAPCVTWGTNPGMVTSIDGAVPDPTESVNESERAAIERALEYMALKPQTKIAEIPIDRVFIGSCTNSRIEDLRAAARVVKGHHISQSVHAMVVPGSQNVKLTAENEGLDQVFREAGFEIGRASCRERV